MTENTLSELVLNRVKWIPTTSTRNCVIVPFRDSFKNILTSTPFIPPPGGDELSIADTTSLVPLTLKEPFCFVKSRSTSLFSWSFLGGGLFDRGLLRRFLGSRLFGCSLLRWLFSCWLLGCSFLGAGFFTQKKTQTNPREGVHIR